MLSRARHDRLYMGGFRLHFVHAELAISATMVHAVQSGPSLQQIANEPVRRTLGFAQQSLVGGWPRMAVLIGAPALLIGVLVWPLLFTGTVFTGDWLHHLSLIWSQSQAIRRDHYPSFFFDYSHSVFYPQYAFYGATVYAFVGSLSLALGDAPIETYVLTYVLAFICAYCGWYWMARLAGLRGWQAQIPGLLFITSAYNITLVYARGDWAEFLAISLIPLLIASGLSVLRADRLRLWPALALATSSVLFFGGHSLTILWGSTILVLTGAAVVLCVPEVRRWLTLRGVLRLVGLMGPALLVNAWFLLPALAYQSHTQISSNYYAATSTLESFMGAVSVARLFAIERVGIQPLGRAFVVTLPVLAVLWTLLGAVVLVRRDASRAWRRMLFICAGATILVTVLMTHASLILALPHPYRILQFSFRLDSYVSMGISGAVLAVLVLARRDARRLPSLTWALVPVAIVAVVGAIHQTDAYPSYGGTRQAAVRWSSKPGPREGGGWTDYLDARLPELVLPPGAPEINFPAASIHDERVSEILHLRPGQAFYSNIAGGPELVHVTGAKIIGNNSEGNDILEIETPPGAANGSSTSRGATPPTEVVSVSPATGTPVALGRILTLCAAIFLVGELTLLAIGQGKAGIGAPRDDRGALRRRRARS